MDGVCALPVEVQNDCESCVLFRQIDRLLKWLTDVKRKSDSNEEQLGKSF
jgi:hypothetical protein